MRPRSTGMLASGRIPVDDSAYMYGSASPVALPIVTTTGQEGELFTASQLIQQVVDSLTC
jgi:hypothetical protein